MKKTTMLCLLLGSLLALGADCDGDGVEDAADNCPTVVNRAQRDTDADRMGDDCDGDDDGDGESDETDPCPLITAEDEADIDCDGWAAHDNCPNRANPDQRDTDRDGQGDLCDATPCGPGGCVDPNDTDGDRIPNDRDNCPRTRNAHQADFDGDGQGDACDGNAGGSCWCMDNATCVRIVGGCGLCMNSPQCDPN